MYGPFLVQVRRSRGLTQRQLAEVSGVSQPNISAIENDRRSPSIETLNRLVVACGYELAAVAGSDIVYGPLPKVGWFPDEDLPPSLPGDPPDEVATVGPTTPIDERVRVITAALEASRPT